MVEVAVTAIIFVVWISMKEMMMESVSMDRELDGQYRRVKSRLRDIHESPGIFNPEYKPWAAQRWSEVISELEDERCWYGVVSREEVALEIRRRYEIRMGRGA